MKNKAKGMTLEEFKKCGPCWLDKPRKAKLLEKIGRRKERWTALDVLNLPPKEVSAEDKLWAVLRPEFIDEPILHEFACRCAEKTLKLVDNPDPRSVAAIEAKRRWVKGEISDEEMGAARDSAHDAVWSGAWGAAQFAAAADAQIAAWGAAWVANLDVRAADLVTARAVQLQTLRDMLEG